MEQENKGKNNFLSKLLSKFNESSLGLFLHHVFGDGNPSRSYLANKATGNDNGVINEEKIAKAFDTSYAAIDRFNSSSGASHTTNKFKLPGKRSTSHGRGASLAHDDFEHDNFERDDFKRDDFEGDKNS